MSVGLFLAPMIDLAASRIRGRACQDETPRERTCRVRALVAGWPDPPSRCRVPWERTGVSAILGFVQRGPCLVTKKGPLCGGTRNDVHFGAAFPQVREGVVWNRFCPLHSKYRHLDNFLGTVHGGSAAALSTKQQTNRHRRLRIHLPRTRSRAASDRNDRAGKRFPA